MGGGGQLGVSLVIHGGGSGGVSIWVVILVSARRDDAVNGGIPHGVLKEYHWQ